MIVLLDTGPAQPLDQCEQEIGFPVQQLLTPLTRYRLQRQDAPFAIDNGAFSCFDKKAYLALLEREKDRKSQCIFVTVPDVIAVDPTSGFPIGSGRRTLEVFHHWCDRPELAGWSLALVVQDGSEDFDIPWNKINAIFVGGSNKFKISIHSAHIIKAAQALDKWVHVGRVNDPKRMEWCLEMGVDSVDGTGISRYTWMRERINPQNKISELFA